MAETNLPEWRTEPAPEEKAERSATQAGFVRDLVAERERQDRKWGMNSPPADRMATVLGEEFGEVCRAILEGQFDDRLYDELVQVAAVACKMAEILSTRWTK